MRVLFRTEIFYHSTSIFAIVPSVTFNTKKGMRISPMSIISLLHYQTSHPATQARLMPSLEL